MAFIVFMGIVHTFSWFPRKDGEAFITWSKNFPLVLSTWNIMSYEGDVLLNPQKRQMSNLLRSRFNLESTSSADKGIYNSKTG